MHLNKSGMECPDNKWDESTYRIDDADLVGRLVFTSNTDIARCIDHTLLKPDATCRDIRELCREAIEFRFFSVCVNSSYVSLCKELLKDTEVKIATVVGFPLGASFTDVKVMEARRAIEDGADEIDMVIPIGRLKEGDISYVLHDIQSVKNAIGNKVLKVIIETCLLTEQEMVIACETVLKSGADFVKTSTGFSHGGAKIEDIVLIKQIVMNKIGIKASGGIRRREDAVRFLSCGVTRIGTSNSVAIMNEKSQ